MSDLVLDLDLMESVAARLRLIEHAFGEATCVSRALSGAVGHDGLAESVRNFADSWDDRRTKIVEALSTIAATTEAIEQAFSTADATMGNAMHGRAG